MTIEDEGGVVDEDEAVGAAVVVVFGTIIYQKTHKMWSPGDH